MADTKDSKSIAAQAIVDWATNNGGLGGGLSLELMSRQVAKSMQSAVKPDASIRDSNGHIVVEKYGSDVGQPDEKSDLSTSAKSAKSAKSESSSVLVTAPLKNQPEELGDRMKRYEQQYNQCVPAQDIMVVRLDGVSFSKWTRGLDSVFDLVFVRAMILTMNDLLKNFRATTAYTHSDEITLVFAAQPATFLANGKPLHVGTHIYGGRVQKLVSVCSSFAAVRFNWHFIDQSNKAYPKEGVNHYKNRQKKLNIACFDGRVLSFPPLETHELANHMLWRSVFDCFRNCTSSFARAFYSAKKLHGVNCQTMIKNMLQEHKFDFNTVPPYLKHGVWAKFAFIPETPPPPPPPPPTTSTLAADIQIDVKETLPIMTHPSTTHPPPMQNRTPVVVENRCGKVKCTSEWTSALLSKQWPLDILLPAASPITIPTHHGDKSLDKTQIDELKLLKPLPPLASDCTIRIQLA